MKLTSCPICPWVLALLFASATASAMAQEEADSRFDALQRRLYQLESEVRQLRGSPNQGPEIQRLPTPRDASQSSLASHCDTNPVFTTCGPSFPSTADTVYCEDNPTFPTVQVGGFFQADAGWFHQSANNIATVGDVQDGADFRRARLNARGAVAENVNYMMEFDFGFPGRPSFMDVYLDVRLAPVGTFRVGQWRQPIGMDGLTSVKELTFLERALPFAFLPFRQIGVGLFDHSEDESMTWAVSAFRFPTDTFGGNVGDNGGYAAASRVTWLPYWTDDSSRILHLGAAFSFGDPANNLVRYRYQPEFSIGETGGADLVPAGVPATVPPFVDTGPVATSNFSLFAVEGAWGFGSFSMQSEAIYAVVNQLAGPSVSFSGAYAQAAYLLTGEIHTYNRTNGVFGRVTPKNDFGACGMGAFELAARWSYLDLNDANVLGGRLNDITIGMNWYLNQYTKFQFNFIHAFLANPTFGDSEADIFALRGQVDF